MVDETLETKTLDCSQSEKISPKIENPLSETMEIENPLGDLAQSDETLDGVSRIEEAQCQNPKTGEEFGQEIEGGADLSTTLENGNLSQDGEIGDAHVSKTLEKSSEEGEIGDTHLSITLEISSQDEIKDTQMPETLEESLQEETKDGHLSNSGEKFTGDELGEFLNNSLRDEEEGEEQCDINPVIGCYQDRDTFQFGAAFDNYDDNDGEERFKREYYNLSPQRFTRWDYPYGRRYCRCRFRGRLLCRGSYYDQPLGYRQCCECRCPDCVEREPEYPLFPLLKWKEPEPCPVGAGLANMGNTCFLNAIMQCFVHTVPLVLGLQSFKHDSSNHGNDEFCVLCAVRDQIENSLAYSGRVISPANLVDNLSNISSFFRRYQQEDAHEFLQLLLDKLDSRSKHEENAMSPSSSGDSLVNQIFGGRLVSQLHCSKCGHDSYTYEPLIDLSLEIEDVDNLESALKSFTKVESLEDTEKITCESCNEQVPVQKQLMLDQAPSVAALHLKRFKSDGVYVEKVDTKVEYPLELDLGPYTKGAEEGDEKLKYELYAVVVHVGLSSTSGHYFCYIRTAPDTWYRFDDSKVTRVLEKYALSQDAYILFYARKGTAWFSSLFEELKACCEKKIFNSSPKSVLHDVDLPSTSNRLGAESHGVEAVEKRKVDEVTFTEPSDGLRHADVETTIGVGTLEVAAAPRTQESSSYNGSSFLPHSLELSHKKSMLPSSSGSLHNELKVDDVELGGQFSVGASGSGTQSLTELRCVEDAMGAYDKDETGRIRDETCSSRVENIIDDIASPSTPPRSVSPGIYSDDEPAEVTHQIPIDHLKIEDKPSSVKKSMDKFKHDLKRKEAAKYCKSMPSGRRQMLMAAVLGGSRSESSLNKKRRKQGPLSKHWQSPKKKVKLSPKRVLRPVVA